MIWYRLSSWRVEIEPVEVLRETEQFVVLREKTFSGVRERRVSKGDNYFPSFAQAKEKAVERERKAIERLEVSLVNGRKRLSEALGLQEQP